MTHANLRGLKPYILIINYLKLNWKLSFVFIYLSCPKYWRSLFLKKYILYQFHLLYFCCYYSVPCRHPQQYYVEQIIIECRPYTKCCLDILLILFLLVHLVYLFDINILKWYFHCVNPWSANHYWPTCRTLSRICYPIWKNLLFTFVLYYAGDQLSFSLPYDYKHLFSECTHITQDTHVYVHSCTYICITCMCVFYVWVCLET